MKISAILLILSSYAASAVDYDASLSGANNQAALPSVGAEPGVDRSVLGTNILLNGNMETNGGVGSNVINNWTIVRLPGSLGGAGAGDFVAYSGTTTPIGARPIEAPTEGTFAAVSDTTGPGSHVMYQDVTIPANGADLTCDVYFSNESGANINAGNLDFEAAPNQHGRIDIMDPSAPDGDTGAGVLQNLFITEAADPALFSYFALQADLGAFSGQTVRLRFAEVDNQFFQNMAVDNCTLIESIPPDADLSVTVSNDATPPVSSGSTFNFTLSANNLGPGPAAGVVVTSTVSDNADINSNSCGAAVASNVVTWNVGALAVAGNATCNVNVTVNNFGSVTNDSTISSANNDPVAGNNASNNSVQGLARVIPTLSVSSILALMFALFMAAYFIRRKQTS
jgi:hypothetical protein